MGQTVRVTLPGYEAGTDTNLDHYALYADVDNVLIKNQSTGVGTLSSSSIGTITHNLEYIPFYAVYAKTHYYLDNRYIPVNNQYNAFQVPDIISGVNGSQLLIRNFQGTEIPYGYDIFYDDMSQTGTPAISESSHVFKVTRPGKDGTSTNPNDYIMHSDLNNFKILKQGTSAVTLNTWNMGTVVHNANIITPYKYFAYLKYPDGKVGITGWSQGMSYDENYTVFTSLDGTNLYFEGNGTFAGTAAYFIYGSGTSGVTGGYGIAVSKAGYEAGTDTNPDHYNFHSNYNSLKYYKSGSYVMNNITSTTYGTVAHNLGYTPFFAGFSNDFTGILGTDVYAMVPYYFGNSIAPDYPNRDIGAFMYADGTNLYCKAWFDTNAVGTYTFTFYYKIFKNNLGL